MDDSRWERYGALGGIVFVVLVIVTIIAGGNAMASDTPAKILKYYRDNQDGLKVSAFVGVLATVPIIWWAGSLWTRLYRTGDRFHRLGIIAVLGLVIGGAGNLAMTGTNAAVAIDLGAINAPSAKFYFILATTLGAGGLVGLAVLVIAVSAAAFRFGSFPRWVAWLGVVDALAFLVAAASTATTSDTIGAFGFVAFILWAIWIVATSVLMYRAVPTADTVSPSTVGMP